MYVFRWVSIRNVHVQQCAVTPEIYIDLFHTLLTYATVYRIQVLIMATITHTTEYI